MLLKGSVKLFLRSKNYGFILPEDGSKDVFFARNVVDGEVDVEEGQEVEYTLMLRTKIPQASRVTPWHTR